MSERKLLLYPYDITNLHFLQFSGKFTDNQITEVIAPEGWGYVGKDAGENIGVKTGLIVEGDFKSALYRVDGVLLTESIYDLDEEHIVHVIRRAVEAGKALVVTRELSKELLGKFKDSINNLYAHEMTYFQSKIEKMPTNLIEKPIVVVTGSGGRSNKFDTQLLLRDIFMRHGYRVTQIGSKRYSNYYGFHDIPSFVFDYGISISDKIKQFSQYVYYLDKTECSDVIVIGIPGGISPYDEQYHNYFGEINYIVSNAINADYVIFNSILTDYPQKYFALLPQIFKYKYNYTLDCIFLSNAYINWDATNDLQTLIYTTLNKEIVSKNADKENVYSVYDERHIEAFERQLMDTLEGYGEYEKL